MATPAFETRDRNAQQQQQSALHVDDERYFHHTDHDVPRMERWLWVMLSSSLAIPLGMFVPESLTTVLFVVAGALIAAGLIMLIVQERRIKQRAP